MSITYKTPTIADVPAIKTFVDYWLSGRAKGTDKQTASNDYFVTNRQHLDYLKEKSVLVAHDASVIVGWAVMSRAATLLHLLVHGRYRGKGIASRMVQILNPISIRSKSDQGTGDPAGFYEKLGFKKTSTEKVGTNKNIEVFQYSRN